MPAVSSDLVELVACWAAGFGLTRDVEVVRHGSTFDLHVEHESRRVEHVVVAPTPDELAGWLSRLVGTDDVWVRVVGALDEAPVLPAGVVQRTFGEAFMTAELPASTYAGRAGLRVDGARAVATVTDDGEEVATGLVAVRGPDATVDRVRTREGHQRRGHAREVMSALQAWAADRGATHGLLVASDQGQSLYRSLGWRTLAPSRTFCGG